MTRATGAQVQAATVLRPSVLRPLGGELPSDLPGRTLEEVQRRGKFLLLRFSDDRVMAINPMLTGAIQYCSPKPESTEGGRRVSVLKRQEGAPVNLG